MLEIGEMLKVFPVDVLENPGSVKPFFFECARNWGNVKGFWENVLKTGEVL